MRDTSSKISEPALTRRPTLRAVYCNQRIMALLLLGFASGLPLQLTSRTLTAWLSVAGVEPSRIGLLSLVTWPYALKFAWAPLMDRFALPLLGRRRGWLIVTQLLLVAAIGGMAIVGPTTTGGDVSDSQLIWLGVLAMVVAAFSASQDIVADAYRTDVLPASELGAGAAVFVTGYRVALILSAGGAMAAAPYLGWPLVFGLLAAMMSVGVFATLFAPEPAGHVHEPPSLADAVVRPFTQFFYRFGPVTIIVLLVVVLFKLPDELARPMTMPLLLDHLKFDSQLVGLAETLALALTIFGALVGGGIVAKLGVIRSLWVFGMLQAISNGGFWLLNLAGGGTALMFVVMGVESLCAGLVTAGFLAFLMNLCDRRYSASQFALLTSLMALVRPIVGTPTGFVVEAVGYGGFFMMTILAGIPALMLLPWVQRTAEAAEQPDTVTQPTMVEVLAD